jgi:hypothetical protein
MRALLIALVFSIIVSSCDNKTKTELAPSAQDSSKLAREADSIRAAMQSSTDTSKLMMNKTADSIDN